jgi:hypothetical protein
MQIYALRGYFTDLRMGRQPNLETKEECHKMLMIVGRNAIIELYVI